MEGFKPGRDVISFCLSHRPREWGRHLGCWVASSWRRCYGGLDEGSGVELSSSRHQTVCCPFGISSGSQTGLLNVCDVVFIGPQ